MELAFRESVRNNDGDIKFPAGVFYEWPKATFIRVADSLGKSLQEATMTKVEAGQIFTAQPVITPPKGVNSHIKEKAGSVAKGRPRLGENAHEAK